MGIWAKVWGVGGKEIVERREREKKMVGGGMTVDIGNDYHRQRREPTTG